MTSPWSWSSAITLSVCGGIYFPSTHLFLIRQLSLSSALLRCYLGHQCSYTSQTAVSASKYRQPHHTRGTTTNERLQLFHTYCGAQWLMGRASDSRRREPMIDPVLQCEHLGQVHFTTHCSSSLSCINEYLAKDSGGYLTEPPSRINCSMVGCFPKKLR